MHRFALVALVAGTLLVPELARAADRPRPEIASEYDVVVYGGTSGGIASAIQAANMGKSVLLIEPSRHIGGLTAGGLGATDIGNKGAIGGMSRTFYARVGEYYDNADVWNWQKPDTFRSRRQASGEKEMWVFEPKVAEKIYHQMLREAKVPVVFEERLDLKNGVKKDEGRIVAIRMESGLTVGGKMFIDATYEGDLLAKAGVSYHVGREANKTYGETLNGVQVKNAVHHQFIRPVDPYVKPGDPESGLLPGIDGDGPGKDGEGDHRVQAYNYRMCTTDVPENRRDWPKPKNYDPLRYEVLLRNFEAGDHRVPWNPVMMPNRKTDTNNNFAFSTDYIGGNYEYPEADYAAREKILQDHIDYQQGLMWTLANSPRVPESVQKHFKTWGLAKDEFTETDNWPHQLYVREARRMISEYVMTQHNCQGREVVDDAVGLAAYTMDSHNTQRYVNEKGHVRNEGDVQVGGFSPYPIAYRSIRPRKSECENLLVPVCLSSSHIAFGSIRMEPVFMVLGQSAATAACQAIDAGVAVQDIDVKKLQERLLEDKQILEWTGPKRTPALDVSKLDGVVVDDAQADKSAGWHSSSSIGGFVGAGYLHDNAENRGQVKATFRPKLPKAGRYEVRIAYPPNPNRAKNVRVTIKTADGDETVTVDQTKNPKPGPLHSIGTFSFVAGDAGSVTISNEGANGHVIVDAVQFVPVK